MFLLLSMCLFTGFTDAFEVSAPESQVLAVRGRSAVLGCRHTPAPNEKLDSLVVTWQRAEDSQVVHSFYYNQDQLERQSRSYENRTSLYQQELRSGNASLRIQEVRLQDSGWYLCSVSSVMGTGKALVYLAYAAYYTEPRLSITLQPSRVSIQYESEGYPEPDIQWLDSMGQNLTHYQEVLPQALENGLLFLRTHVVVEESDPAINLTFTLKNRVLNQQLERPVSFSHDGFGSPSEGTRVTSLLASFVIFLLLFIGLAIFVLFRVMKDQYLTCLKST